MNDEELIRRLLRDDALAFDLLRAWIRSAFRPYARRLAHDLEDLEQDVLFGVTQDLRKERFEGRSRLRTYVTTYVHHKCIDRVRAQQRRTWVSLEELELPTSTPSTLDRLTAAEQVELARQVVAQAPDSCRELWDLLLQGLDYREMGERLGVREVTLRSRVLRCRRLAAETRARLLEKRCNESAPTSTK